MYKHDNGIVTWTQKKGDGLLILNNTSRPPPSILVLLASAISCDIKILHRPSPGTLMIIDGHLIGFSEPRTWHSTEWPEWFAPTIEE